MIKMVQFKNIVMVVRIVRVEVELGWSRLPHAEQVIGQKITEWKLNNSKRRSSRPRRDGGMTWAPS